MFLKILDSSKPAEVNAISITLTSVLDLSSTLVGVGGVARGMGERGIRMLSRL